MATILLIEDEAVSRKLARLALQHAGHRVVCSPGATDAVALARRHRPALAMVAIAPQTEHYAMLARALKADAPDAGVPVHALLHRALEAQQARFLREGFDVAARKPLSLREWYRHVLDALRPLG